MESRLGSGARLRCGGIGERCRFIGWGLGAFRLPLETAKQHHDDVLDISLK